MSKVILITGTSSGLGASVAAAAAKLGHKVYATMRDVTKGETLAATSPDISVLPMDVQDSASVEQAVAAIIAKEGHIDVLINNAGIGFVRSTEQATLDDVNRIMDVNFMSVVRTCKAVIPLMRKARSGHIINITSVGGLVGQPFNEVYCASKFAIEGYTEALATYVQPNFNIKFSLIEPGGIKSEFANTAMKQVSQTGGMLDDEYLPIIKRYLDGMQSRGDTAYQTSEQVAEVVIGCMQEADPPLRVRTSAWAEDFCSLKTSEDPTGTIIRDRVIKRFLP